MSRAGLLLAILGASALTGTGAPAVPQVGDASGLPFDVWQVEAGLEQDAVTAVVQTRDGYLWLGTYAGLMRFDGVRVTVFASANAPDRRRTQYFEMQGWICIEN